MGAEQIVRLGGFVVGSALLAYVSRSSLRRPASHGFFRFFAWESILGLFVLNVASWFSEPFSPRQWVSWCLLTVSLFLVLHGVFLLRRFGRPDERRDDLFGFEKTTTLVTRGAYRYIRHPLYSSLLFLAWGIFLKAPSLFAFFLAVAATGFLIATAHADERESLRFFGSEYRDYLRRTKRFVPFLF